MTESTQRPKESELTSRLKALLDQDIALYIDDASEDQKQSLLVLLKEIQASDESESTTGLKHLLRNKNLFRHIEAASEDRKRRLLLLLEDLRASDRREDPRRPCFIEVTLDDLYKEFIRDISATGVFIETSVPFQPGMPITLILSLPNQEEPLKISGTIVRKVPGGIGVKFTTTPSRDLQKLMEAL